ncbi:hypothetical protein D9M69_586750 [compost metagenome]
MTSSSAVPVKLEPPMMSTSRTWGLVVSPSASISEKLKSRLASWVLLWVVTRPMSTILITSLSVVGAPAPGLASKASRAAAASDDAPRLPTLRLRLIPKPVTPSVDTSSWAP